MALAELRDVALGYGRKPVLEGVSLAVEEGDFLGIVGPNGSGKTTLLRAMLGVLRPMRGTVRWDGERMRRGVFGYVPQRGALDEAWPLSALEIVMMGTYPGLPLVARPGRAQHDAAEAALQQVGIADLGPRLYRDLSGGQKQRVLIARALAARTEALLLDEPTNGMDLASERELMDLVAELHQGGRLTIVLVSHLLQVVLSYVSRVALIHEGVLRVFDAAALKDGDELAAIYGLPVTVREIGDQRVVVAGREGGERSGQ